MNAIVNKLSLAGVEFMPEMHLRKSGSTYIACGPFTKNKERIKKIKEIGDSRYIYQNAVDKACFQLDIAYGKFKDLNRRTVADQVLRDKAFNIAKNQKYNVDFLQWSINFLIKKLLVEQLKTSFFLIKN